MDKKGIRGNRGRGQRKTDGGKRGSTDESRDPEGDCCWVSREKMTKSVAVPFTSHRLQSLSIKSFNAFPKLSLFRSVDYWVKVLIINFRIQRAKRQFCICHFLSWWHYQGVWLKPKRWYYTLSLFGAIVSHWGYDLVVRFQVCKIWMAGCEG